MQHDATHPRDDPGPHGAARGRVLPGAASARAKIPTVDVTPKLSPGPTYDFHTAGGRIKCDMYVGAHGTAVDCAGPTKSASRCSGAGWSASRRTSPTRRARAAWCAPARGCASTSRPTGWSTSAGPSAPRCSASTRGRATASSSGSPSPAASDRAHAAEGRHRPTAARKPGQRVAGGGPRGGEGASSRGVGEGYGRGGESLGPRPADQARRRVGRRRRGQTHSRAGRGSSQASASRVNARAVFA